MFYYQHYNDFIEDPHPALYLVDKDLKDISMDLMNTKNDAEAIENDYAELLAAKTSTGSAFFLYF